MSHIQCLHKNGTKVKRCTTQFDRSRSHRALLSTNRLVVCGDIESCHFLDNDSEDVEVAHERRADVRGVGGCCVLFFACPARPMSYPPSTAPPHPSRVHTHMCKSADWASTHLRPTISYGRAKLNTLCTDHPPSTHTDSKTSKFSITSTSPSKIATDSTDVPSAVCAFGSGGTILQEHLGPLHHHAANERNQVRPPIRSQGTQYQFVYLCNAVMTCAEIRCKIAPLISSRNRKHTRLMLLNENMW